MVDLEIIEQAAKTATEELSERAGLEKGMLFVVGCSSSEIGGQNIGTDSHLEVAQAVYRGVQSVLLPRGIYLAAQCCEHLGRALIVERAAAEQYRLEQVNVIPQPKAGGSFGTAAYENFSDPVAVERIEAHAGLDIGGTLIGMHLRRVAVPVRLSIDHIGEAILLAARTRLRFVGGARAKYDETLM